MRRFAFLALLALLMLATASQAVIMKLTPLAEVLESEQFIFVAAVDKTDPEKPSAVFKLDKKLKGEAPFERIPVNMTGDDEAKKAGDTKTILDRLDATRKVVFFVSKRGKKYNAMAFVEGSWFSMQGTIDDADKTVRWAFLHGEPFLRRTFKGTSAELVKVIEDGLAKKAKPPGPDEKEKPGYGPQRRKKKGRAKQISRIRIKIRRSHDAAEPVPVLILISCPLPLFHRPAHSSRVIPSFVLVGPLAIIAALFPGVFARMAVGMKRWRAFLVVASINSTLAIIYWLHRRSICPPSAGGSGCKRSRSTSWSSPRSGSRGPGGVIGAWPRRNRSVTGLPSTNRTLRARGPDRVRGHLRDPHRDLRDVGEQPRTAAARVHLHRYRARDRDCSTRATARSPRRSITSAMLRPSAGSASRANRSASVCSSSAASSRCSNFGARNTGPIASGTETGDADTIGPRFVGVKVFEVKERDAGDVGHRTRRGDRLYFGTRQSRDQLAGGVQLFCLDRDTGEVKWKFERRRRHAPGLLHADRRRRPRVLRRGTARRTRTAGCSA